MPVTDLQPHTVMLSLPNCSLVSMSPKTDFNGDLQLGGLLTTIHLLRLMDNV